MEPVTKNEILDAFEEDVGELPLPDLNSINWEVLDYLGWVHPSGHVGYVLLVSPRDGNLRGTMLSRSRRHSKSLRYQMCSLCSHVHRMEETAMFTITVRGSNDRHHLGNVVCKNLDCSLRIRNLVEPDSYMNETLYLQAKVWRMQKAIHRWLDRADRL